MSVNGRIRGFDFHCHIDLHPKPATVFDRCASEGIVSLTMTTTPKAWPQNSAWVKQNDFIHVATGLHPELVGERYADMELLETQINESHFVGEVGLDGSSKYQKSYGEQQDVFHRVLVAAQEVGARVLSIHSRRAERDVINIIEKHVDPQRVLCILHWFSGSPSEAQRALEAGCYFSINHTMLASDGRQKLIRDLPANRLLTETDSPFTLIDNRKSMPWDVITTTTKLAEIRLISQTHMNSALLANARHVFSFAQSKLPSIDLADAHS